MAQQAVSASLSGHVPGGLVNPCADSFLYISYTMKPTAPRCLDPVACTPMESGCQSIYRKLRLVIKCQCGRDSRLSSADPDTTGVRGQGRRREQGDVGTHTPGCCQLSATVEVAASLGRTVESRRRWERSLEAGRLG